MASAEGGGPAGGGAQPQCAVRQNFVYNGSRVGPVGKGLVTPSAAQRAAKHGKP